MDMTEQLAAGVDVWLNTPRRPWEASGTSGMKVLVNGGLNVSELDGWWAEAYSPEVGWAIGDGQEHGDDPGWDKAEAEALYALLEREIVPEFYTRDEGIPKRWVMKIRDSMARLTPLFSANRVVREYTERHYLPAAAAYGRRAASGGAFGAEVLKWRRMIATQWGQVGFGAVKVATRDREHFFEVQVFLNGIDPDSVRVEVYADPVDGGEPVRTAMTRERADQYSARVPAARPVSDYTPRVIPFKDGAFVPLEANRILWQR
jgi:starch phosphorylase